MQESAGFRSLGKRASKRSFHQEKMSVLVISFLIFLAER